MHRLTATQKPVNLAPEVGDRNIVAQEDAAQQTAKMVGRLVRRIALGGTAEQAQRNVGANLADSDGRDDAHQFVPARANRLARQALDRRALDALRRGEARRQVELAFREVLKARAEVEAE